MAAWALINGLLILKEDFQMLLIKKNKNSQGYLCRLPNDFLI